MRSKTTQPFSRLAILAGLLVLAMNGAAAAEVTSETAEANLSRGMKLFKGAYTQ